MATSPVFIESPEDFRKVVHLSETAESLYLEFKRDLHGYSAQDDKARRDGQKEFCRDVSAFANAWGGCLLIGVEETEVGGKKVASAIRGVAEFDGRRQWMEQAIRNYLVPNGLAVRILPIHIDDRTVISVNVTADERPIVLWDSDRKVIQSFRRTNDGKGDGLHPDQVEGHAMNARRAGKIMFHRVLEEIGSRSARDVELTSGVWRPMGASSSVQLIPAFVRLSEVREHEFTLAITPSGRDVMNAGYSSVSVPYGLVREAWTTVDQKLGLLLHVRIVYRERILSLEPF